VTERELARGAARRLAIIRHVQEVTGNVALTCRYYGITRQCYYVWFRRYEEFGVEGLRDRSSRPHLKVRGHANDDGACGSAHGRGLDNRQGSLRRSLPGFG
jgi:Helix-turn-helix domain